MAARTTTKSKPTPKSKPEPAPVEPQASSEPSPAPAPNGKTSGKPRIHLTGFCTTERKVRDGSEPSAQYKGTDPFLHHRLCKGCDCPHHLADEKRCALCNRTVRPGETQCTDDPVACQARHEKAIVNADRAEELRARQIGIAAARSTERKERKASEPRATTGACEHCGAPTKGGKFAIGHDAKLKSILAGQALGQQGASINWKLQADALAELMIRGWITKKVDEEGNPKPSKQWMAATKIYNDAKGRDEWLAARIAARIKEAVTQ